MNRIDAVFTQLRQEKKKAFIPFFVAGIPDYRTIRELVLRLEECGVALIELGVPFSDPLADGPIIQMASTEALKMGVTSRSVFSFVEDLRKITQIPIALLTYCNPIFKYGVERFVSRAITSGVDGIIAPDLPPDESALFTACAKRHNLKTIFLATPTTTHERLKKIASASTGFLYYVSVTGITGPRDTLPGDIRAHLCHIKRITRKPVCVGFGISHEHQARMLAPYADGIIVGSALVRILCQERNKKTAQQRILHIVKKMQRAVNAPRS
ncbi:MAG: tryptophan synthase subunit alpha [Candidatus Omnitrophica bacterium]|nr:tryptophan synthase subunit alpha [Candidatus Omnitrophota bacterium]